LAGDVPLAARSGTFAIGGDLPARRLGFGAMRITGRGVWGAPPDPDVALKLLRRACDLGVNLIDTADSYGPDVSELLIAEALHPYPDNLVIATKGGYERVGPFQLRANGRPEHLRAACEASLSRLRLERIDLYQLHTVDGNVPLEESIGALDELRSEGKVRHLGLCNVDTGQLARARAVAPIVSVQNRFNLVEREGEPVCAACERDGLAFIAWFPLARGAIASGGGALRRIARAHGSRPAQVALAWLLQRSPVVIPIPGTASLDHLEQNVAAAELQLTAEELRALEDYGPLSYKARRVARRTAKRAFVFLRRRRP
jgi:pyridoxine 4-dehydrogenase